MVDNNSHDGSVEMIRTKYPQVKLIANSDNKLFAIANNQGAEISKGDYLLLLNSDTLIYSDNVQRMVEYFDTLPKDVICIGPKVLNPDKTFQSGPHSQWGTVVENTLYLLHTSRILPQIKWLFPTLPAGNKKTQRCGWVAGCAMMMRADLYNKVGGLNEEIEFYGEEPEFGYRTHRLGYKTVYWPEAEIVHLGGVATKIDINSDNKTEEERETQALRRFDKLVIQTCGRRKAIDIARATKRVYALFRILHPNKQYFTEKIRHENEIIDFLKNQN